MFKLLKKMMMGSKSPEGSNEYPGAKVKQPHSINGVVPMDEPVDLTFAKRVSVKTRYAVTDAILKQTEVRNGKTMDMIFGEGGRTKLKTRRIHPPQFNTSNETSDLGVTSMNEDETLEDLMIDMSDDCDAECACESACESDKW